MKRIVSVSVKQDKFNGFFYVLVNGQVSDSFMDKKVAHQKAEDIRAMYEALADLRNYVRTHLPFHTSIHGVANPERDRAVVDWHGNTVIPCMPKGLARAYVQRANAKAQVAQ